MRKSALAMILVGLSTGVASAQVFTVASGVRTRIVQHWSTEEACHARHLTGRVTVPPEHGKVTVQEDRVVIPAHNAAGHAQTCVGKAVRGMSVYYQSARGFVGEDRFSYLRLNADDAGDRANGEVSRTVTVR